ncbi:MAG: SDR family NAD(P)-dependent oxidoreductase [Proteobacteria bacterium]|nr:SDR family NAD(P)-dependent oxidoreductase [Pseudomonadota bacterium]MBU1583352.1 SDR family NAD(P)-dependent oxidoreductase [Pseudomonadota bacterium]MBU2453136.1 SDR family NAD(P)-dependent oxidoreductase [Pseudomonadota bacterium]MBU2631810.1 SDR family NAD(P)-dependent oxidoreductase [Pseudomonadota bacterium]
MPEIKDTVAVITGGGGGIGKALARHWIDNGGKVVIADISEEILVKAKEDLGPAAETFLCNVTREEDNFALASFAIEKFGKINMIAPFAGIISDGLMINTDRETGKVKKKMSLEQFQRVVEINLTGVFLTVRECAEQMVNNNCRGLICLISSTGSLGTAGQINYSSTKAAISVMPKVITAEFFRRGLSDKIRCVAIAPGYVGTEMVKRMNQKALANILSDVPIKRLIKPEEVAALAGDIFRNEALAGDTFFIHGGLRLGSKG